MGLRDRLRGPAQLVALAAAYAAGRPREALPAARIALDVGLRVRRASVLRSRPDLLVGDGELTEVATLVSDTHVTTGALPPAELVLDPGQWPYATLPTGDEVARGILRVLEHVARHAPRTVLWCGDEVDSGAAEEWERFRALAESIPHLVHHLVPGNHDINFNLPFVTDHDLTRRAIRIGAFERHAPPLASYPITDTIVGDAGPITVIMLDSCRHPSTHVLSNAIGRFGDEQLAVLARVLGEIRGPVLCVAHHHVWRDARFLQPDAWFNCAVDADVLTRVLGAYRRRDRANHVLICHGHRHCLTAGEIGDRDAPISVVGMPSTTLGDKAATGRLDGMLRYLVAGLADDGTWRVAARDIGPLIAEPRLPNPIEPSTPPDASLRAYALVGDAAALRR